ncbi:MAG: Maf family protein [Chthoniobacterales bacterium]
MHFVLASSSPRRRDLLREAGFEFKIARPPVAEIATDNLSGRELTVCNATRKALAVARSRRADVVLGADTLVALDGKTIGKPSDLAEARRILRRLSGRQHVVYSAVFICRLANGEQEVFHEISAVEFRHLDDCMIERYLEKIDPLDKAGAYAAQGEGAEIIARVDGSFTNVVGLPMERTIAALRAFGVRPRRFQRTSTGSGRTG